MISPIKISPFARRSQNGQLTLQQIIDYYGFLHFWSAENLTIAGTTTTALDYKGVHDLANPSAASQPTYNAVGNIGGKPTLTFNGVDDVLTKAVANWRISDTTGVFFGVFRQLSGNLPATLTSSDGANNNNYAVNSTSTKNSALLLRIASSNTTIRGTSDVLTGSPITIFSHACSGSQYYIVINAISEVVTAVSGVNNGANWLANVSGRDDVTIGARLSSTHIYSNTEWFCSGYLPFVSEAQIISLQNDIKTYLGI